jgi:hypothetical protein
VESGKRTQTLSGPDQVYNSFSMNTEGTLAITAFGGQMQTLKEPYDLKINRWDLITAKKEVLIETPIVIDHQNTDSIESLEEHLEIVDDNSLEDILHKVPEMIDESEIVMEVIYPESMEELSEMNEEQKNKMDENPNEELLVIETESVKEQENQVL